MATTSNFTPGPWRVRGSLVTAGDDESLVADCSPSYAEYRATHMDVAAADARLIAAAPDLLEACKAVHREMCDVNQWARDRNKPTCSTWAAAEQTLGAAIAKATEPTP